MTKELLVRCFSVTVFVFLMLWTVSQISNFNIFNAFDPISQALGEFELTDHVFSNMRPSPEPDPRIVLVNIGPSRLAIAEQIRIISQHKPKVIGIDSYFNCEGGFYDTTNCPQLLDTLGNLVLANAIQEAGNVVLVSRLLQSDSIVGLTEQDSTFSNHLVDLYDSMETSDPVFTAFARQGFANLPTENRATYQEDVKIVKKFVPRVKVNGVYMNAFAVEVTRLFDSTKVEKLFARKKAEEIINFRGNFEIPDVRVSALRSGMQQTSNYRSLCFAIDWDKVLSGDYVPSMFENSIVIMGFLGSHFGDTSWEDKFFSPLNTKVAGRANPDMFGLVVHANIVAMLLNEDYVDELDDWQKYGIAFLVCFLNVALFTWVDRRFPVWFDGLSVVIQLLQILMVAAIIVFVFAEFNFKLDLTVTMASMALIGPCFDIYKSLEKTLFQAAYSVYERSINAALRVLSKEA